MNLTSAEFIITVIVLAVLYYIVPKKAQWPLLLVGSLGFYYVAGRSYKELIAHPSCPPQMIYILVTFITAFICAYVMGRIDGKAKEYLAANKGTISKEEKKAFKAKAKSRKWAVLLIGLFIALGLLCVTKYTNFVIANVNSFLKEGSRIKPLNIIVPAAISYYTFQTCSYVIDVYRGKTEPQKNPFKLLLFVTFFPLLVQGPICRYDDLAPTLFGGHKLEEYNISQGLTRIIWGFFKKMVVANRLAPVVIALAADTNSYRGTFVFILMLFYAFDLYCDFTGGIDITIGIARVFGINVAENFNLPYFSKNIKEYWNRWHITMGTWFTDYIFYPVSVCGPMLKLSKWSREHLGQKVGKRVTVYLSSLLVWFTTGLWHGAAWNFIIWGLMNYVVIMISQELEPLYAKFHSKVKIKNTIGYGIFEIVRTILLMSMIRMFDVYRNVPLTFKMVGTMFTKVNLRIFTDGSLLNIGLTKPDYIVLLASFAIILTVSIIKARKGYVFKKETFAVRHILLAVLLIAIVVFGAYGVGYDSTQFIYNQF